MLKTAVISSLIFLGLFAASSCSPEQMDLFLRAHAERSSIHNHPFLVCVRGHESDTAGGYSAKNSRSTASGAYQFLDSTWRTVSVRSGHGGYSTARSAPPHVQDAVAYWYINNGGRSAWNGTGC